MCGSFTLTLSKLEDTFPWSYFAVYTVFFTWFAIAASMDPEANYQHRVFAIGSGTGGTLSQALLVDAYARGKPMSSAAHAGSVIFCGTATAFFFGLDPSCVLSSSPLGVYNWALAIFVACFIPIAISRNVGVYANQEKIRKYIEDNTNR